MAVGIVGTDRGYAMALASGRSFFPLDPREDEIFIEDIADSLSNLCRYNGHCKPFYSVAQHSLHVMSLVPDEYKMTALLHDVTEAYLGDMIRPIKVVMPEFREIENRLYSVIARKFGLHDPVPECVKHADNIALATEIRDLHADPLADYWGQLPEPDDRKIVPLDPGDAREKFFNAFAFLDSRWD